MVVSDDDGDNDSHNHNHNPDEAWWRHQMETFSALLALCAGNSPVTSEFPVQRPATRSFDVFFDLHLHKRLSKQSWGWWFEMPSLSLWRHSNGLVTYMCQWELDLLIYIQISLKFVSKSHIDRKSSLVCLTDGLSPIQCQAISYQNQCRLIVGWMLRKKIVWKFDWMHLQRSLL